MAYATKYRFQFDSANGTKFKIIIQKDGYTGSIIERNLGAAPILRRDNGGSISGTSLEITAECQTNGEFAEFYTTSPYEFKIVLYADNSVIWQGYSSTEIYSEPDIAPPYDVQITATDGLGELKGDKYSSSGSTSLHSLFTDLLSATGLSLDICYISSLAVTSPSAVANTSMWSNVVVDLGQYNGKTKYDVLSSVLTSFNAKITQINGRWLIYRDTDIAVATNQVIAYKNTGAAVSFPAVTYGTMTSHNWWPVGQMSTTIEPAKNRIVLTAPNNYREALTNPDMDGQTGWTKSGCTYDTSEKCYKMTANATSAYVKQSVSFDTGVTAQLLLTLKVSSVNSGTTSGTAKGKVLLKVKKTDGSTTKYLTNASDRTGEEGTIRWATSADSRVTLETSAPASGTIDSLEVIVPLYNRGLRAVELADTIEITIYQGDTTYDTWIYGCSLVVNEQIAGYQDILSLNNSARGEADEVELAFTHSGENDKAKALLYGVPGISGTSGEALFKSAKFTTGMQLLSLMARDYAVCYALPRMVVSGTLNVPGGNPRVPAAIVDSLGNVLIPKTFSWDLRNDELQVEAISVPSADITVSEEVIEAVAETTQSRGSSGSSSGGGSSSDPYVLPAATYTTLGGVKLGYIDNLDKIGVDLDSSANLFITLTEYAITSALGYKPAEEGGGSSGTYTLPPATSSALGGIKIGFSESGKNVPVKLATGSKAYVALSSSAITSALGYTPAQEGGGSGETGHTHANKAVLDGISADDVSNWDEAYSWGDHADEGYLKSAVTSLAGLTGAITKSQLQDLVSVDGGLNKCAPLVKIQWRSHSNVSMVIEHPSFDVDGVEAVLMMYSTRERSKNRIGTKTKRKGWHCAMGNGGNSSFTFNGKKTTTDSLALYILRNYCTSGTASRTYMKTMSWSTWKSRFTGRDGFGTNVDARQDWRGKKARRFGIALRMLNPDFVHYSHGSASVHTNELVESGVKIPRYIYTNVQPLNVIIDEEGYFRFSLVEYKS